MDIYLVDQMNAPLKAFDISILISAVAICISGAALYVNVGANRRNTQLTIQQLLFKTISEKAKDCNKLWEAEQNKIDSMRRYIRVVSELVITLEIVEKSFVVFTKNDTTFKSRNEGHFYYLLWKQLDTSLRDLIREKLKEDLSDNITYKNQIKSIESKLSPYFE